MSKVKTKKIAKKLFENDFNGKKTWELKTTVECRAATEL